MAARDQSSTGQGSSRLASLASQHVGSLIPLVGVLIFAIRCTVVSRGDLDTAAMLAAETSIGDAIRAVLITAMRVLFFIGAVLIAWTAGKRLQTRQWFEPITAGLLLSIPIMTVLGAYFTGAFTSPVMRVALAVGFLPVLYMLVFWTRERLYAQGAVFFRVLALGSAVVLALMVIYFPFTSPRFWLPPESFTFKNQPSFTGYLLKGSEDYLLIFEDRRRMLTEQPKTELLKREFCYLQYGQSVRSGGSKYLPECPKQ